MESISGNNSWNDCQTHCRRTTQCRTFESGDSEKRRWAPVWCDPKRISTPPRCCLRTYFAHSSGATACKEGRLLASANALESGRSRSHHKDRAFAAGQSRKRPGYAARFRRIGSRHCTTFWAIKDFPLPLVQFRIRWINPGDRRIIGRYFASRKSFSHVGWSRKRWTAH